MKKQLTNVLCLLLGAVLGVGSYLLVSLMNGAGRHPEPDGAALPAVSAESDGTYSVEALISLASDVADCLRRGDYTALADYVHPVFGLVFSPNPTIHLDTNLCFTAERVAITGEDDTIYVWGTTYGTGEPIQLTSADYFRSYVYDRDYLNAPLLGVNHVAKSGNALENVDAAFPDGEFVDFCYPASTPDGKDWRILRMVFEPCAGSLRLSALIHSEYTD